MASKKEAFEKFDKKHQEKETANSRSDEGKKVENETVILYCHTTRYRTLLEGVFGGSKYEWIVLSEAEAVIAEASRNDSSTALIVATIFCNSLRVLKQVKYLPLLIVTPSEEIAKPREVENVEEHVRNLDACVKLGAELISDLVPKAILSRSVALMKRYRSAKKIYQQVTDDGATAFPKIELDLGGKSTAHLLDDNDEDFNLEATEYKRMQARRSQAITKGISKKTWHLSDRRFRPEIFNDDEYASISQVKKKLERVRDSGKAHLVCGLMKTGLVVKTSKETDPNWRRPQLGSPRTSAGLSQRSSKAIIKLLQDCLGSFTDESKGIFRTIEDILLLVEKHQNRVLRKEVQRQLLLHHTQELSRDIQSSPQTNSARRSPVVIKSILKDQEHSARTSDEHIQPPPASRQQQKRSSIVIKPFGAPPSPVDPGNPSATFQDANRSTINHEKSDEFSRASSTTAANPMKAISFDIGNIHFSTELNHSQEDTPQIKIHETQGHEAHCNASKMSNDDNTSASSLRRDSIASSQRRGSLLFDGGVAQRKTHVYNLYRKIHQDAPSASHLRRGLRDMLKPKTFDVLLNDFQHVEPKLIRSSPSAGLLQKGYAHYKRGAYEDACQILDDAATKDPKEVMIFFWRALAEAQMGFYLQTVRDLDHALKLLDESATKTGRQMSTDVESYPIIVKRKDAADQYRNEIILAITFNRSIALANMGDDQGALKELEQLLRKDPSNERYRTQRAIISRRSGHWTQAYSDYQSIRGNTTSLPSTSLSSDEIVIKSTAPDLKAKNLLDTKYGAVHEESPPLDSSLASHKMLENVEDQNTLDNYKRNIGQMRDVYDTLFNRPTEFQVALSIPPTFRDSKAIAIIVDEIRLLPVLDDLSLDDLSSLAGKLEYRILGPRDVAFAQGERVDACCIIMKGNVEINFRPTVGPIKSVGKLGFGDVFGHDALLVSTTLRHTENSKNDVERISPTHVNATKNQGQRIDDNSKASIDNPQESPKSKSGASSSGKSAFPRRRSQFRSRKKSNPRAVLRTTGNMVKATQLFGCKFDSDDEDDDDNDIDILVTEEAAAHAIEKNENDSEDDDELKLPASTSALIRRRSNIRNALTQEVVERKHPTVHTTLSTSPADRRHSSMKKVKALVRMKTIDMKTEGKDTDLVYAETYVAKAHTELLLIPRSAFEDFLRKSTYESLREVYAALVTSRIFQNWSKADVFHLSRYARKRRYKKDSVLVHQGEASEHLIFLIKGVCEMSRYSDRPGYLRKHIETLENEREEIRLKYVYHYSLRNTAAQLPALIDMAGTSRPASAAKWRQGMTLTDYRLEQIDSEIRSCKEQLDSALRLQTDRHVRRIGTIMPPKICGEAGLVDPNKRDEVHSVIADTTVEAILIHKTVFQLFDITHDFRESVRRHAMITVAPTMQQSQDQASEHCNTSIHDA